MSAFTGDHAGPRQETQQQQTPSSLLLWRNCTLLREQSYPPSLGWQSSYWKHQVEAWRAYDVASCCLKVFLLLGNVKRSLGHGELLAVACAGGAAVLVIWSLVLMLLRYPQYSRHRRLVMWSHLTAISIMMATSMPQFLSATSGSVWAHKALVLLFKMGVTWPIMAALMHRLPWQDMAVLCSTFCIWLCWTWPQPLCTHLHGSMQDAQLVRSLAAALDTLTGLGMDMPLLTAAIRDSTAAAGGGLMNANCSGQPPPMAMPEPLLFSAAGSSAVQAAAAQASSDQGSWAPLAHHITAVCSSSTSAGSSWGSTYSTGTSAVVVLTGTDCQQLIMGQCMAVATTLTLWVGVLVILFLVVLSEQHSKWRWWHSSAARWQVGLPHMYVPTSVWGFLGMRLLYLHVLLDVPLMVLWVASSSWYRQPTAPLGGFNLW